MRKILLLGTLCSFSLGMAQDFNTLFIAGVNDAERFAKDYLAPISEASIYSISNGWYNTAEVKPLGGFEISIIGNLSGFKNKEHKKTFVLDPKDYENLDFVDNPGQPRPVATALGDIQGVFVFVEDENGTTREEIELPSGLAAEGFDFIPSAYVQGSVGLSNGLEVKARFLPKLKFDDDTVTLGLFGAGIQYEFTQLLPADKLWPVAISAVIGYTGLDGEYHFTESVQIDGDNQRIEASFHTWNFSAVAGTRNIPVINFYAGIGYVTGTSDMDVLGTYEVKTLFSTNVAQDPFTLTNKFGGVVANLGAKLKLGFFRVDAAYSIAEFHTATVGIHFGIR